MSTRLGETWPRRVSWRPTGPPLGGLEADPIHQVILDEELAAAGIRRPSNPIGIGWAGPTLLHAGTPEQQERHLFPILSGDEIWCQLFSETEAGSDLAAVSTRAERDGDDYVIHGTKVWTSLAHHSKFGILLARTGRPRVGPGRASPTSSARWTLRESRYDPSWR